MVDNNLSESSRRATGLILLAAVLAAGVFWIVDSALLAFVFRQTTFAESAFHARPYPMYHRLLVLVIALGLGLVAELLARKRRQVQEEHDRLFELASDPLCVLDSRGRFSQVNPAWKKVLGWKEDKLVGRPWLELVHPDDKSDARSAQKDFTRGRSVDDIELRLKGSDGEYRWILLVANAGKEAGETYMIAHDITYRRDAEESLERAREQLERKFKQRSEELYQTYQKLEQAEELHRGIVKNVGVALLVANGDKVVRMVNDELCELVGYQEEELEGKPFLEKLVASEDRERVDNYHQQCLESTDEKGGEVEFSMLDSEGGSKSVVGQAASVPEAEVLVYTIRSAE